MPVLAPANRRVRIVTMPQLNPAVIKSADIVYVGYLSGLGMLFDIVFAGSRLQVGDSFDEIVDRSTHQRYISRWGAGAPLRERPQARHHCLFAGRSSVRAAATHHDRGRWHARDAAARTAQGGDAHQSGSPRSLPLGTAKVGKSPMP